MDYNTKAIRQNIISICASLQNDKAFRVTSPDTYEYNCIAWAMGMNDRWVDSANIPWHWWPQGAIKNLSKEALVDAFRKLGFETCSNGLVEDGYDKVALYSKDNEWKHAARVLSEDVYSSKMGALNDFSHSGGDVLCEAYGSVYQFMRRPIADRHLTNELKGDAPGEIHLNSNVWGGAGNYVFFHGELYLKTDLEYVKVNLDDLKKQ